MVVCGDVKDVFVVGFVEWFDDYVVIEGFVEGE